MVITEVEKLTPELLTSILQRNKVLVSGEGVTAVESELLHGTWSKMYRIRPTYDAPNAESLPQTFLLKICAGENGVFGPSDLERIFGLTGGNIFQGSMCLNQLGAMRPVPGWSDHRTPITGLYICGSAAHPGGGVMGSCGKNAAIEMLKDGK